MFCGILFVNNGWESCRGGGREAVGEGSGEVCVSGGGNEEEPAWPFPGLSTTTSEKRAFMATMPASDICCVGHESS